MPANKTINIYGASDDLIEVEGAHTNVDEEGNETDGEFDAYGGSNVIVGFLDIAKRVRVACIYNGVWSFAPGAHFANAHTADDESLPVGWSFRITQHPQVGYSALLEITLPTEEAHVRFVKS